MKNILRKILTSLIGLTAIFVSFNTHAAIESNRFYLEWSGTEFGNSVQAQGFLTIETALFPSAGSYVFLTPGVEILDFSLTVSGASAGNDTFTLSDFSAFSWYEPAALDFSQELVGQETGSGGWGSTSDGSTGDFSLFANEDSGAPFSAGSAFQIATAEGLGDVLQLTSFRPAPVPVPAAVWLFGSGLLGMLSMKRGGKSTNS